MSLTAWAGNVGDIHRYGSEGISEQRSFQLTAYQTIYLEKILGHIEAFLGRLKTHLGSSSDGQRPDEDEDVDLVILIEELRLASGLLAKLSFSSPASSSETSSLTHPHYHPNEISTDEILGEMYVLSSTDTYCSFFRVL